MQKVVVRSSVVDLVAGGVVEGVARRADGTPWSNAEVLADSDLAPTPPKVRADADGRFRLEGLTPGSWRFLAMLDEAIAQDLDPAVDVEAGKTATAELSPAE